MELLEKYFFQPKTLKDLLTDDYYVVFDTNVLLAAYQWKDVTVQEVLETLQKLVSDDRLRIPRQVIKEFFDNRPQLIVNMISELNTINSQMQISKKRLKTTIPALGDTEVYLKVSKIENDLIDKIKDFHIGIDEIKEHLIQLMDHDPVLDQLKNIFQQASFTNDELQDEGKLNEQAQDRFNKKIPPGFKDSGKSENKAGDFFIWAHILKMDKHVIFVSTDTKNDWVIKDPNDRIISARRELIEEFYSITGKSFRFVTPKDFFVLYKPTVSEEIKTDLEKITSNIDNLKGIVSSENQLPNMDKAIMEKFIDIFPIGIVDIFFSEIESFITINNPLKVEYIKFFMNSIDRFSIITIKFNNSRLNFNISEFIKHFSDLLNKCNDYMNEEKSVNFAAEKMMKKRISELNKWTLSYWDNIKNFK